jgi:hypothetical protein
MHGQRMPGRVAGIADRPARAHGCGDRTVRHHAHRTVDDRCEQNGCCGGDARCETCELEGK